MKNKIIDENYEKLGTLIDDLESLCCGLELKMSADFHLEQMKEILPKKVRELKEVFENITGEKSMGLMKNQSKEAIIVQFKTKAQKMAEIRFRHLSDHLDANPCNGCIDINSEYCLKECRSNHGTDK